MGRTNMRSVKRYSLLKKTGEKQYSKLVRDGKELNVDVEGSILEAQYELEDGSKLIWLIDDSP